MYRPKKRAPFTKFLFGFRHIGSSVGYNNKLLQIDSKSNLAPLNLQDRSNFGGGRQGREGLKKMEIWLEIFYRSRQKC